MRWAIIVPVLGLMSCGQAVNKPLHVDPLFNMYYEHFTQDAAEQNVVLSVDDLEILPTTSQALGKTVDGNSYVGMCYYSTKVIKIAVDIWETRTQACKEEIIYHELGHCLLKREHNNKMKMFDNGRELPYSIMMAIGGPCEYEGMYNKYRDYYVKELFHP